MIRLLIKIIFFTCFCACDPRPVSLFREFQDQDSVMIILSKYELDTVPPAIGDLKSCENLIIVNKEGWSVFPPESAWASILEKHLKTPPFRTLPAELMQLTRLRSLSVANLDLVEIPEGINNLHFLEELNVSFNKMDITRELYKLESLHSLRKFTISGNKYDTLKLENWSANHPEVVVITTSTIPPTIF